MKALVKYRIPLIGSAVGLSVCLYFFWFYPDYYLWMIILWPSIIMLGPLVNPGITVVIVEAMSVAVNMALYAALAQLLAFGFRLVRRLFQRMTQQPS